MNGILFLCRISSASWIPRLRSSGSELGLALGFELGLSVGMMLGEPIGYALEYPIKMLLGLALKS